MKPGAALSRRATFTSNNGRIQKWKELAFRVLGLFRRGADSIGNKGGSRRQCLSANASWIVETGDTRQKIRHCPLNPRCRSDEAKCR